MFKLTKNDLEREKLFRILNICLARQLSLKCIIKGLGGTIPKFPMLAPPKKYIQIDDEKKGIFWIINPSDSHGGYFYGAGLAYISGHSPQIGALLTHDSCFYTAGKEFDFFTNVVYEEEVKKSEHGIRYCLSGDYQIDEKTKAILLKLDIDPNLPVKITPLFGQLEVALGFSDAFFMLTTNPLNVAPVHPIIEAKKGIITDNYGNKILYDGTSQTHPNGVLATNNENLHRKLVKILTEEREKIGLAEVKQNAGLYGGRTPENRFRA